MRGLWRDKGGLFNLVRTDFWPKAVDGSKTLAHKTATMIAATKRTTTTKKPSGASGGVRA
jgi:hypothetical protein